MSKRTFVGTVLLTYDAGLVADTDPIYQHVTSGRKPLVISADDELCVYEPIAGEQDEWLLWEDHECVNDLARWSDVQLNDPRMIVCIELGVAVAMPINKAVAQRLGIEGEKS